MARNSARWSGTTSHLLASGTPLWSSSRHAASHLTLRRLSSEYLRRSCLHPSPSLTLVSWFSSRFDILECTSNALYVCTLRCPYAGVRSYTCVHAYRLQAAPKSRALERSKSLNRSVELTSYVAEFLCPRDCREVSGLPPARRLRFLHDLARPPFMLTRCYRAREFRQTSLPRLLKCQMLIKISELSGNREITELKSIPGGFQDALYL